MCNPYRFYFSELIPENLKKAMEYYEDAIRNLKNAKSEQVASALLINTAEKLQNGISQQWINQFLHDPDLREKGRHQVVKYLSDAATIRNDDFVVGKFSPCLNWEDASALPNPP